VHNRDEQGGADDRPQHWKGMRADLDYEGLRQHEPRCDPGPKEGADEPESRGHDEPAAGPTGACLANGVADGRDDDEQLEVRQRHHHDGFLPPVK
jgi:hypothetical protein